MDKLQAQMERFLQHPEPTRDRCGVCQVPLTSPVQSDNCPTPEDHADGIAILVTGSPTGFRFIGPVIPGSFALKDVTDNLLADEYWWYIPLTSLDAFRKEFEA